MRKINIMVPLGWRYRNPLNITRGRNRWEGEIPKIGRFCKFSSFYYGLRAAYLLLTSYQKMGYYTVEKIVRRWAPPIENHTQAYIGHVCRRLKLQPGDAVPFDQLPNLIVAMGEMEIGKTWFHRYSIRSGMDILCKNNNLPFPSLLTEGQNLI